MANKITKRDVINSMLSNEVIKANDTYVAYLTNELAILDKKKAYVSPNKANANADVKAQVIATLEGMSGTVTDIQKANEVLATFSNQKVSAVLRELVNAGTVVKTVDKKKSIFSLA